ncbi:hypothetical protein H1R81_00230 [Emticicia sp. BO119]|nr:hypothetical protein [Emticicia sp. BO119]
MKTANLTLPLNTNTLKKVWQPPQFELIEIKSTPEKMLLKDFIRLDPHAS